MSVVLDPVPKSEFATPTKAGLLKTPAGIGNRITLRIGDNKFCLSRKFFC